MSDGIFLRLSSKYALGCDDLQWIVFRSRRKDPSPLDAPLKSGRGSEWEPVSVVSSTKEILLRCCGQVTCDEAAAALESYPSTFREWRASGAAGNRLPGPCAMAADLETKRAQGLRNTAEMTSRESIGLRNGVSGMDMPL